MTIDHTLHGLVFDDIDKGTREAQTNRRFIDSSYGRFFGVKHEKIFSVGIIDDLNIQKFLSPNDRQDFYVAAWEAFKKLCDGNAHIWDGMSFDECFDPYSLMGIEYGISCDCCGIELNPLNKARYSLCENCDIKENDKNEQIF